MIIFSLYFIYFSIKGGNSYNSTFFISLLNLIVNFYFILFSKKKFDFLKLNILQKFNIQKKLLIIIFLTSSLTSISYAIKEKNNIFSNSKDLSEYLIKNDVNCDDISSYDAWEIGSWLPYFSKNKDCKIFQLKTNVVSGFWDLNYWENDYELNISFDKYDFAKESFVFLFAELLIVRKRKI